MTCEQWKVIEGFENYAVSSLGRVKSVSTGKKPKIKATYLNDKGYVTVVLYRQGRGYYRRVARLVAQAFIPNPKGLPEVNHKKGDQKQNNAVTNLEWKTRKGNVAHAVQNNLHPRGSRAGSAKLNTKQIKQIREMRSHGLSHRKLAGVFGVHHSVIGDALRGETWKHA